MTRWRLGVAALTALGVFNLSGPCLGDEVRLSSGETLKVEILEVSQESIRLLHPVLGEITLPRAVVEILPAPETSQPPAVGASPPAPAAPPAAEDLPREVAEPIAPPPPEWKFKLVLAAGFATGNTENGNFSTILGGVREKPETRLAFDTAYFFAQSDGDRSQNRFTAGGRHDWLNPGSKWFYFWDGRYDVDEFQSWDSRVNTHVGLGYRLASPPKLTLNALAGIGLVKEFGSENEDIRPEALLGIEGKYDFTDKHSVAFSSTIFPDLEDTTEFRWVNSAAWTLAIDGADQLSLSAGVQHEHQTQVDPGRDKDDFRLFAGVQYDF